MSAPRRPRIVAEAIVTQKVGARKHLRDGDGYDDRDVRAREASAYLSTFGPPPASRTRCGRAHLRVIAHVSGAFQHPNQKQAIAGYRHGRLMCSPYLILDLIPLTSIFNAGRTYTAHRGIRRPEGRPRAGRLDSSESGSSPLAMSMASRAWTSNPWIRLRRSASNRTRAREASSCAASVRHDGMK